MVGKYKSEAGGKRLLETYDLLLRAWGVEVAEEDVATPYGSTHLVTAGDPVNPPLVLFHGVGDDAALMWLLNAKALAERFRLVAVDTMGGPGKSMPNEEYFKGIDQVRWIDAVLDAKGLDTAYLAGVSMGAYLTQLYTAKRPERVIRSVCMAGSVAVQGSRGATFIRMMKVFLPEALFPNEKNARKLLNKMCGSPHALDGAIAHTPVVMEHWLCLMKHFNNRHMFYHRNTGLTDAEIAVARGKSRILLGACDRLAQGSEAYELLKKYDMNHRIVENAGHALNMEMPELVNEEIVGFLLG
jgi:pimeloyl-ACP methyl ester carboxylesterase